MAMQTFHPDDDVDCDIEFDYDGCPHCGHRPTYRSPCTAFDCDGGLIDEYGDDPINYSPGEAFYTCATCRGCGELHWCPKCGTDLNVKAPA